MRNPTRTEVVNAINRGMSAAQAAYRKAYESHIFNPQYCPEYFTTVHIFQSLLRLKGNCGCAYGLALEQSVKEITSSLPARPGPYSANLRVNGKCDLMIWDVEAGEQDAERDTPLAAVEVKENANEYQWDIRRLAGLVQRGLPYGVFASCHLKEVRGRRSTAEGELIQEIESLCHKIRGYLRRLGRGFCLECKPGDMEHLRLTGDEYRLVWCPLTFVISRRESRHR